MNCRVQQSAVYVCWPRCLEVHIDFLPALASCLDEQLISTGRLIITPSFSASLPVCLFLSLSPAFSLSQSRCGASGAFFDPYCLTYIECRPALGHTQGTTTSK